ncbi:hypothetical protein [Saccharicrinis aurantiacus]|uniref:hypothetical protein n=1 Tax=Saccharicrinis aurantiacus TaxID=1849719 RepID=UPI00094FCC76|nr:hypothetical protein [Saccharicrinis aurantiacus]
MRLKKTKSIGVVLSLAFNFLLAYGQDDKKSSEYSPYELLSSYYHNDFKPFKKGSWYVGMGFDFSDQKSLNTKGLLQNVLDGNDLNYSIQLKGGYYTGDYGMVGLNLEMYESEFVGMVFRDPDTLQTNSITRGYSIQPNIRSSVPLTRNERLSFFTMIGVGYGIELTNTRDIKNIDEISKTFSTTHNIGIGISPGVTFFAMENFAFEVQLNVLGYDVKITNTEIDGIEQSKDVRHNVNFNIDILSLDMGLAYYF